MTTKSLLARQSDLSDPKEQLKVLSNGLFSDGELPTFSAKIAEVGHLPLKPTPLEIFQVNVGYMCNQVCSHCHVDAGPDRKEIMTRETMRLCLDAPVWLRGTQVFRFSAFSPRAPRGPRWCTSCQWTRCQ